MERKKYCPFCKKEINAEATRCIHCKKWLDGHTSNKPRNFIETFLMCWFLGQFGVHRFYTGYYVIGTIQLLTLGGCGIWTLVDFISIALNGYKDANNESLLNYKQSVGIGILILQIVAVLLILMIVFGILVLAIVACPEGACE